MKIHRILMSGLAALTFCISAVAQEMPEMPQPRSEHKWLQQLAGEWESEMECTMEPGKPPVKNKMTEKARSLGGFWLVSEGSGEAMGAPFSSILTLGYDPGKKKYIGSWVDSMTGVMWQYEGNVGEDGKTLTLETEGPCPMKGGKICKFREVIVLQDENHKTFTSRTLAEDGTWTTFMSGKSVRTK